MENVVKLQDWKARKMPPPRPVTLPQQLVVRLSDEHAADLRSTAANDNTTVSEIIRQILETAKYVPSEPIRQALRELNCIGVNINQIARALNSAGMTATVASHLDPALNDLRAACQELRRCLN